MNSTVELTPKVVAASTAGAMAVMLLAALDGTIVGTALPRMVAELQGFEHYAGVTTAYLIAGTVAVPFVGKLSDLYGRRPFLLAGVAIFVLGSGLCGAATSMLSLVASRAIQGLGGGIAQSMAFTTIADLYPPARRGRVTGLVASVFGFASVIGPTLGGFLADGPGWRWCFYINLPIGLAAFGLLFFVFPRIATHRSSGSRIDWIGGAALTLGVGALFSALAFGGRDHPWNSSEILWLVAAAGLMSFVFVLRQKQASDPFLPPSLFRNRVVWASSAATLLMSVAMFGSLLFVPLFLQGVVGGSASESGAAMTPMMLALVTASVVSGQLMTRLGRYKTVAVVGATFAAIGMVLLSRMDMATTYGTAVLNMMVMGVGLGLALPVFSLAVQNSVDVREVGTATSALQFLRSIGGAVGAAGFGAVLSARFSSALHERLTTDVAASLPPRVFASLSDSHADPVSLAQLPGLESAASGVAQQARAIVQSALTSSLQETFLLAALVSGAGFILTLMLIDVPLRHSNAPQHVVPD